MVMVSKTRQFYEKSTGNLRNHLKVSVLLSNFYWKFVAFAHRQSL